MFLCTYYKIYYGSLRAQYGREMLRNVLKIIKEQWEKVRTTTIDDRLQELKSRLEEMENKLEMLKKERKRRNVVITGIKNIGGTDDKTIIHEVIETFMERNLQVDIKVKSVYKIGENRYVVELEEWGHKLEIMRNKNKLKGQPIFIDNDLTFKEINIQKEIRKRAEEEKKLGATVRVGYQKIQINDRHLVWNEQENRLVLKNKN